MTGRFPADRRRAYRLGYSAAATDDEDDDDDVDEDGQDDCDYDVDPGQDTSSETSSVSDQEEAAEGDAVTEGHAEEGAEEGDAEEGADPERDTLLSKNGKIEWSSVAFRSCGRQRDGPALGEPVAMPPGPTRYAVTRARDILSTFLLFITPEIEALVLHMTNYEGSRKYADDSWTEMDETDLRAYMGLLILAGVYRSRGEATASLWDAESGRPIFRATMPLKRFHAYSSLLRFDDRQTRPARRATDKLAAIRSVFDSWVERLPRLYNPGPDVTVDEQLIAFRGSAR